MPEGPQVRLVGEAHTRLFARKRLRVDSPNGRADAVAGVFDEGTLDRVEVIGKHLLYRFGRDAILHVHLGRFGRFASGAAPAPGVRGIVRLRLRSESAWAELRGATAVEAYDRDDLARLRARLGPDPLNGDDLAPALARVAVSRSPIGTLLLDQSVIAGIGNIYRAETLFRLGISPMRPGRAIDPALFQRIWLDVGQLMEISMCNKGRIITTEPEDRPSPKKKTVARIDAHYVYHRASLPCRRCGTPIVSGIIGARDCYWCPACQPATHHG